jgi:bacterioferritin-associated ferredoxin
MQKLTAKVDWPGREQAEIWLEINDQKQIKNAKLTGVGGTEFLNLLKSYRGMLQGALGDLPLPVGQSAAALCLRELILKIKGEWVYPYSEEEICHCRAVPTAVVDQAICTGAHTTKKVSEQTSASTACGTCRPDVAAILKFRLGS